jgi:exonuclease SbcD
MSMKFLHIADLHLGKRVCEYPMLEDQRFVLEQIKEIAARERVDAILIAGDVYDRPVPSQEATALLSDFLCALAEQGAPVLMIAGNHDSAERLAFCDTILEEKGLHVAGVCRGVVKTVVLEGEGGPVAVHRLSHTRPAALRPFLGEEIESTEDALRAMLAAADLTRAPRNILMAHVFATGGETSESEQNPVGTLDSVPLSLFAPFDYVALGHLHRPQTLGGHVRYAGSPLCYSFSEVGGGKSVTLVEIGEAVTQRTVPLIPLHPMREVRGALADLLSMEYSEDYVRAVVTDEEVAPDARLSLRTVFPNLMRFAVENSRTNVDIEVGESEHVAARDPMELFCEFYYSQMGVEPDAARQALMREAFGAGEVSE